MTRDLRSRTLRWSAGMVLSAIVCVAVFGGGAIAGAGKKPSATPKQGEWSSATEGPHGAGGRPVGAWDVGISGGALKILPHDFGLASGIVPPYWRKCTGGYVPMLPGGTEIPINGGKFNFKLDYDLAGVTMKVHWKGRWKTKKLIKGKITLSRGDCTGTRKWAGAFGEFPPDV